jgi:serine protease Do
MRRNRDWIKLAALVGLAAILGIGFTSIVGPPKSSEAQPVRSAEFLREQPLQEATIPAARPLAELGNAFTAVAEAVRPAVVFIEIEISQERSREQQPSPFLPFQQDPQPQTGGGSGFLISDDGYILTNNHVVENASRVDVNLFDDRQFEAEIVGRDANTDVAVIKIEAEDLPFVQLGNSDDVAVGQWVLAIGTPLAEAFSFTVTAGIVSARGRLLQGLSNVGNWSIQDFIQTDAAINRRNSGGPLVNVRGEVIGINSAIASRTGLNAGYGFAIPSNLARHVAEQLISEGRVRRAALGVTILNVDQESAQYVGLDEIRGVVITGFSGDNSPAQEAGLQERDVIVDVDGEEVQYISQLQQTVGFKSPGETIDVTVMRRGGESRTYSVRLIEANTETETTVARRTPEEVEYTGSFEPRLGIAIEEFDRALANRMGIGGGNVEFGLVIMEVDREGPARGKLTASSPRSGYLAIITNVDDRRVHTKQDLDEALAAVPAGEVVALRIVQMTAQGQGSSLVFVKTADGDR